MSLDLSDAFKDSRTRYFVNDKAESKTVLFGPTEAEVAAELKHSREVDAAGWDAFVTKSQRLARAAK